MAEERGVSPRGHKRKLSWATSQSNVVESSMLLSESAKEASTSRSCSTLGIGTATGESYRDWNNVAKTLKYT